MNFHICQTGGALYSNARLNIDSDEIQTTYPPFNGILQISNQQCFHFVSFFICSGMAILMFVGCSMDDFVGLAPFQEKPNIQPT